MFVNRNAKAALVEEGEVIILYIDKPQEKA